MPMQTKREDPYGNLAAPTTQPTPQAASYQQGGKGAMGGRPEAAGSAASKFLANLTLPPGPGATPKGTGGIRKPDQINDVPGRPPRFLGPPVSGGGRVGPGPIYIGPPVPAVEGKPHQTKPKETGPGTPLESQYDRPKRLPPEPPPDWTPWDDASGGPNGGPTNEGDPPPNPPLQGGPRKTGGSLPRNPGDDDMPPREQSLNGRSEGWAGQGGNAMASGLAKSALGQRVAADVMGKGQTQTPSTPGSRKFQVPGFLANSGVKMPAQPQGQPAFDPFGDGWLEENQ